MQSITIENKTYSLNNIATEDFRNPDWMDKNYRMLGAIVNPFNGKDCYTIACDNTRSLEDRLIMINQALTFARGQAVI